MKRFIEGEDGSQSTLFPEHLDDYIAEDNPVRVIDVFVDELDLVSLGFEGMQPEATGRPGYHPASLETRSLGRRFVVPHSLARSSDGIWWDSTIHFNGRSFHTIQSQFQ